MSATADRRRVSSESCADDQVMSAVQAQNGDALEVLIQRYRRMVQGVATGILRDAAEAEDVTQEVFLEVYRKAYLFDPTRGNVRMWLLQYAYHRSLRRKASLRLRAAYRGETLDHAEGPLRGFRRHLTSEESNWMVRSGLAQLPERQRVTLELAFLDGLSLKDVAVRLGVSLGSARHYYYRGLARLRAWAEAFDRQDVTRRHEARCSQHAAAAPSGGAADTPGAAKAPTPRRPGRAGGRSDQTPRGCPPP